MVPFRPRLLKACEALVSQKTGSEQLHPGDCIPLRFMQLPDAYVSGIRGTPYLIGIRGTPYLIKTIIK